MLALITGYSDPLPLDTNEADFRRYWDLRHSLSTGQGIQRVAVKAALVRDIKPERSDRLPRLSSHLFTETHRTIEDEHATLTIGTTRDVAQRVTIVITDENGVGAPRTSVGINSISDVISGQYKPVRFVTLGYSVYHYHRLVAQRDTIYRHYVPGFRLTKKQRANRHRIFDPIGSGEAAAIEAARQHPASVAWHLSRKLPPPPEPRTTDYFSALNPFGHAYIGQ